MYLGFIIIYSTSLPHYSKVSARSWAILWTLNAGKSAGTSHKNQTPVFFMDSSSFIEEVLQDIKREQNTQAVEICEKNKKYF